MKTFLVITKLKSEQLVDNNLTRYKVDEKGKKYFYVNTYLETWKHIIETQNEKNVYDHFKKSIHKIVNVEEVASFGQKNKRENKQNNTSTFSLGELFKDQLAEFSDKNCQTAYVKTKNTKQLKKKFSKEIKRYVKDTSE